MSALITSPTLPGARFVGSRLEPVPATTLRVPAVALPTAGFRPFPLGDGRVELRDARGLSFGIFASEDLAQRTIAFLTP
jgi:hypothetical protein